jgi:molybdopterin molybdotransferase
MVTVDEAVAAIRRTLAPLASEECPIEHAHRRVVAAAVTAKINQPPFNASAMDGYAVHFDDVCNAAAALDVVGISSAGEGFHDALPRGAAVRIFTGAPVPSGADHVLIQEEAEPIGEKIVVKATQSRPQHVRVLGVDFKKGEALVGEGERLTGAALALLAAGNLASVSVTRRPRVAVIANGDELIPPGSAMSRDQIICSIPYGLLPLIEEWGAAPSFLGIAPDNREGIRRLAEDASDFDLIVPIGGASVGDRDYMRPVFAELRFETVFDKVSLKPGKPTWFATKGKRAVIGLPGNPASAFVTARLFLKPAVERLLGSSKGGPESFRARTSIAIKGNGPRESYLRARLAEGEDGVRIVTPFEDQDSSLLSVMARADTLIHLRPNAAASLPHHLVECLHI